MYSLYVRMCRRYLRASGCEVFCLNMCVCIRKGCLYVYKRTQCVYVCAYTNSVYGFTVCVCVRMCACTVCMCVLVCVCVYIEGQCI